MVLVRELMTVNPNTIHPNMSLIQALDLMADVACRQLPVLENGLLVGIITDRDMRLATRTPAFDLDSINRSEFNKIEVSEFMTPDPLAIDPDAPIQEAAKILNQNGIGALPVVEGGILLGILTVYDILDYVSKLPSIA